MEALVLLNANVSIALIKMLLIIETMEVRGKTKQKESEELKKML